jgi:hypothetical protein
MVGKLVMMKMACSMILDAPLEAIASDKKSIGIKILSGIAIGILSCFSFGAYAVYAHNFFSNRKVGNLQKDLEKAVEDRDCKTVQQLLKKHPLLKTKHDLLHNIETDSHLSLVLPLAAESGGLEMVKLLCDNGASLEAFSRGSKTALERALAENHKEIIKYLVDKGANISRSALFDYIASEELDFDTSIYLVKKMDAITSVGKKFSILGIAAQHYDENPDEVKKLIQLLIQKGDRFVEADKTLNLSDKVQQLIEDEIEGKGTKADP